MENRIANGHYDDMFFMNFTLKTNKEGMVEIFDNSNNDILKIGELPAAATQYLDSSVWNHMCKLDMNELKKTYEENYIDFQSDNLQKPSEFVLKCLTEKPGSSYPYTVDFTKLTDISPKQDYVFTRSQEENLDNQVMSCQKLQIQLDNILKNPLLSDKQRTKIRKQITQRFESKEKEELNLDVLTKLQKFIKPKETKKFAEQTQALQSCLRNVEAIGDLVTNPLNPEIAEIIETKKQDLQEKSNVSRNNALKTRISCAQENLNALYSAAIVNRIKYTIKENFKDIYDIIAQRQAKERAVKQAKVDETIKTNKIRMLKEAAAARRSKEADAKFNLENNGVALTSQEQAPLEKIGRETQQQRRVAEYKKNKEETKAKKVAVYKNSAEYKKVQETTKAKKVAIYNNKKSR